MKGVGTFLKPVAIGALAFIAGMIVYDLYKDYRAKRSINAVAGPVAS